MRLTGFAVLIAGIAVFSPHASAQSVPAQRVVTIDMARTMGQEALATCRASGVKVTVLVVDALNMPKLILRDDGATASSVETAKMKALQTMLYERPSGPAQPPAPGTPTPPAIIPGTVNATGAFPIKVGNVMIGAISVSGATGSGQDATCAAAGLAKIADQLK